MQLTLHQPTFTFAKLWNNQGNEKNVKELKSNTYKAQSKQTLIGSYYTMMTPAEREIAMKPMKKSKQQDKDKDTFPEAPPSEDKIHPKYNRSTGMNSTHITNGTKKQHRIMRD